MVCDFHCECSSHVLTRCPENNVTQIAARYHGIRYEFHVSARWWTIALRTYRVSCNQRNCCVNLASVTIQLLDINFNVIKATITDTDGNYKFDNLAWYLASTLLPRQTWQLHRYIVKDIDGGDLNGITVNLARLTFPTPWWRRGLWSAENREDNMVSPSTYLLDKNGNVINKVDCFKIT